MSSFEQLNVIVHANISFMKPALLNRYYQEYYINRNGDRLTIDRDIRYRNCRNGIIKNDPNVVVELKYSAKKENNGLIDLVIIEIQTGVCNEDDIIRIEDDFGRVE